MRHITHYTSYIVLFALLALSSCKYRPDEFVDLTNVAGAKNLKFQVISQSETNLSDGIPNNCYLPGGEPINEWAEHAESMEIADTNGPRKTSSVTATAIIQSLLKFGNQNEVIEIVGTYPSLDHNWDLITLSGKIILPKNQIPKRLILVSHYTVGSNGEAPSNCFSLEGLLVKLGYGLIIPDYQGYGLTSKMVHPYLVMDITAIQVVDMYRAAIEWLKAAGRAPEYPDIYLMGYSQGGAVTMAVLKEIETENEYATKDEEIKIRRVFAGGGPYDVKATYERFVTTNVADYPVAVPLVLQGMIAGNNLNMKMSDMMQPWLCAELDNWINSKRYTTGQINTFIGTHVTRDLLTKEAMDQKSDKVAELYKAMTSNSIIAQNWDPQASIYMMHSIDDETVTYTNAANAKSTWRDANITYNFGHYGGHIKTCVRFILTVQSLLVQEEEESKLYE